jgi:predicted phosphodiesterase
VLVIADIHSPYTIDGYLEFCRKQQEKRDCGTIIYIGDIMDFNAISYHEKTPEELNPKGELAKAREVLKDWYDTFPNAYVCWGNHDLLPYRQAKTAGLMREFIQTPHTIFQAPATYKFVDEIELN